MRLNFTKRQQSTILQRKTNKTLYQRRINRGRNQPLFINLPDRLQVNVKQKRSVQEFPKVSQDRKFGQVRQKVYNDSVHSERISHSLSSLILRKSLNKSNSKQKQYKNQQKLQKQCGRILNIIYVFRDGLKYNIKQAFIVIKPEYELKKNFKRFLSKIQRQIFLESKHIYLFHLNRQPISNISQIYPSQYSIFVDRFPKLNIPKTLQCQLNEKIRIQQDKIKEAQKQRPSTSQRQRQFIQILQFADHLILDPFNQMKIQSNYNNTISKQFEKQFDLITSQKEFQQKQKQESKIQQSVHSFKFLTFESSQLQQKIKNERNYESLDLKKDRSVNLKSKKSISRFPSPSLNLLNIPYLMKKYYLSRFDIINLHSLYQSLTGITNQKNTSSKNTIDFKTLQKGLYGAGINIGKQTMSSACLDNKHISWGQFLKVVSISSCKTPQEKLQHILQNVNKKDSSSQYLTHFQIDMIIHSFLTKLLQKVDKSLFNQLKQYLHKVILLDLDPSNNGKIQIKKLKSRVLQQGKQNDLTMFLFLHS